MARFWFFLILIALSTTEAFSQSYASFDEFRDDIESRLEEKKDELIAFRRDLHQNPEVSGQEKRTAEQITKQLIQLGLEVRTGIGGHGVVALLKGANPGPVVAFRADMDAVYTEHPDPVDFPSKVPGVRHICGHDIHTTVGIALAEGLSSIREEMAGSVLFIFQPAEENVQGARAMLADGAIESPRPDAIFAFHTASTRVGQISTKPGPMLAGRDNMLIRIKSNKSLESIVDTVEKAIQELSTVRPGQMSAQGDFFMPNVFRSRKSSDDNSWEIFTNITTTSNDMRAHAQQTIRQLLDEMSYDGFSYEMEYVELSAGVNNDPTLEQASRPAIQSVIGPEGLDIEESIPTPFSEDFGSFQQEVPGVMYFLGVSNPEKGLYGMPHSPNYAADEEAIFVGAKVMAAVMLDYMRKH